MRSLLPLAVSLVLGIGCGQNAATKVTLSVVTEGSGTVTSTPAGLDCGATCSASFAPKTSVTLQATPASGQVFAGWAGACSGSATTCTVTLEADSSVVARFEVERRTVTVTLTGNGTGTVASAPTGLACPGECSVAVARGASTTLTATAGAGSTFVGWTGGGCSGTDPCVVTANDHVTVQAAFALKSSLVVSRDGTGAGAVSSMPAGIDCGSDCAEEFAAGQVVTLAATAGTNSTFTGWSGACSGLGACSVTMSAPQLVTANFVVAQVPVTVTRSGSGSGVVTSLPAGVSCGATCSALFDVGSTVTLTAAPDASSSFLGWSGACTGTGPCTLTVSQATAVTATFGQRQYTLTVTKAGSGAGQVMSMPAGIDCGTDCTEVLAAGTSVTLAATAAVGSTFIGWAGAGCSGTSSCTVPMTAAAEVTATFSLTRQPLGVSLSGSGGGTVTSDVGGIQCGVACAAAYDYGASVTLTAAADPQSIFVGWGGGCSGTGPCVISMTAPVSVTAVFALGQQSLTIVRSGSGTGTVISTPAGINCGVDCGEVVPLGTPVTLTATAAAGSTFDGWSGGGCSGTGTCVVNVTTGTVVTAVFSQVQFPVVVTKGGTGAGTVTSFPAGIACGATCAQSFDEGTPLTLSAVPATGSTFTGWSGAGCAGTGSCQLTVSGATSVTAIFTANLYNLTVSLAGPGLGTVTSSPPGIACGSTCVAQFAHGTPVTLTAVPAGTSVFSGWSGACTGTGACVITLTGPASATATFAQPGVFFTVRDSDRMVQRFSPSSPASPTNVGVFGPTFAFGDLAWSPTNNTMYAVEGRSLNSLFTVNTTTGAGTLVGVHGVVDMFAIAWHPPTSALYGVGGNRNLYRLNTTTGAATLIGATGITAGSVDGLAWDSTRSRLVALTAGGVTAYSINVTTGAATTVVAGLPFINNHGMTYDAVADRFVVADYDGNVFALNPTTFARTTLATMQGSRAAIAWQP